MAIRFTPEYWRVGSFYHPKESYTERRERRKAERAKLEVAGFKTEYSFPLSQENKARAQVKLIKDKTGVELEMGKAFGMSF